MEDHGKLQGTKVLTITIYEADFTQTRSNGEELPAYFSVIETPEGKEIRDPDNGYHLTLADTLGDTVGILGNAGEEFSELYRLLTNWKDGFH